MSATAMFRLVPEPYRRSRTWCSTDWRGPECPDHKAPMHRAPAEPAPDGSVHWVCHGWDGEGCPQIGMTRQ